MVEDHIQLYGPMVYDHPRTSNCRVTYVVLLGVTTTGWYFAEHFVFV